jgi:hypothetical protein
MLSTESAWDFCQEVDMEINAEQEKIPTDELATDQFRYRLANSTFRIFKYTK